MAEPSPIGGPMRLLERRDDGLTATYHVGADEPVLAGHFPGFPIFPGVCLIECTHQAALLHFPAGTTLAAVERVRFHAPVFPGDDVTVRLSVNGWTCRAEVHAQAGNGDAPREAALIRLRYQGVPGGPD